MERDENKLLGFGCMRFPLLNSEDPKSIDYKSLYEMVDLYLDSGFGYFDTAYMYHGGLSEVALRKALVERYSRDRFTITDKWPSYMATRNEDYEIIFKEQLEKTGAGYFDYYWLHNLNLGSYETTKKCGGFEFLKRLKKEGRVRNIGFSFHDGHTLLDEILTEHPELEYVQLQINYLDWNNGFVESRKNYETAIKHNRKVIVMEPVKGGRLSSLPEEAISILSPRLNGESPSSIALRFAASLDGVVMVLSGMSRLSQLEDNIKTFKNFRKVDEEDIKALDRVRQILLSKEEIACTSCAYCTGECPMNINIPGYFALYNSHPGNKDMYKRAARGRGLASECIECGECELRCPQHLPVRKLLKDVRASFED